MDEPVGLAAWLDGWYLPGVTDWYRLDDIYSRYLWLRFCGMATADYELVPREAVYVKFSR